MSKKVEDSIRKIIDFPKKGIVFRDVTTAIRKPDIFKESDPEPKIKTPVRVFEFLVGAAGL